VFYRLFIITQQQRLHHCCGVCIKNGSVVAFDSKAAFVLLFKSRFYIIW